MLQREDQRLWKSFYTRSAFILLSPSPLASLPISHGGFLINLFASALDRYEPPRRVACEDGTPVKLPHPPLASRIVSMTRTSLAGSAGYAAGYLVGRRINEIVEYITHTPF